MSRRWLGTVLHLVGFLLATTGNQIDKHPVTDYSAFRHENSLPQRAQTESVGQREPEVYGRVTLADIEAKVRERAAQLKVGIESAIQSGRRAG